MNTGNRIVSKPIQYPVAETLARLAAVLKARGVTIPLMIRRF
jgi:hypothetical protein